MTGNPIASTLLALAFVGAALGGIAAQQEAPPTPPVPAPIPAAEKRRPNPFPATPASIENGRLIYTSQCAMCHGTKGDGKGDFAPRMDVPVPDLTDAQRMAARTDGELFYIVSQGHGRMKGTEQRLSEERRWNLVNLMRSMSAAPASAAP